MLFVQFTGLSGAGKTTLAYRLQQRLRQQGYAVEVLDGDECRKRLWPELGFSDADRQENLRRLGYVAHLLMRQGVVVLMAAINPFEQIRAELSQQNQPARTVFVSCDLPTLISRDTKGLYARAFLPDDHPDKLTNLTGVNAPYEPPNAPDLTLHTGQYSEAVCEKQLVAFITAALTR